MNWSGTRERLRASKNIFPRVIILFWFWNLNNCTDYRVPSRNFEEIEKKINLNCASERKNMNISLFDCEVINRERKMAESQVMYCYKHIVNHGPKYLLLSGKKGIRHFLFFIVINLHTFIFVSTTSTIDI